MTVEEIDILVQTSIEGAIKQFKKLLPNIKKQVSLIENELNNVNFKDIKANIDISSVGKEVQKVKKQIKEAFDPTDVSGINFSGNIRKSLDEISMKYGKLKGSSKDLYNAVELSKYRQELSKVNTELDKSSKVKFVGYDTSKITDFVNNYKTPKVTNNVNIPKIEDVSPSNKSLSMWDSLKNKIEQIKPSVSSIRSSLDTIPRITQNITNNVKNITSHFKVGLFRILKYAGALFSLRSIYSILSSSASSWLSTQNAEAKQLSANINYMKNALGSALAPVIQYVTNLAYRLLKVIQSVAYAFSGVNIFAKATASSMNKTAGSAKQTNKSLSSIHSEINNVSENKDSGPPSIDLSKIENMPNTIIDTIKNGNWYQAGTIIGQKLNEVMDRIPWETIKQKARNIGHGLADILNGFIAETKWDKVGNTIAQGLNTGIGLAHEFVKTFQFKKFGQAISEGVNNAIKNTEWKTLGETISGGIKGALELVIEFIKNLDTDAIAAAIIDFATNIDWFGIAGNIIEFLLRAILTFTYVMPIKLAVAIGEAIIQSIEDGIASIQEKIKENGGNVVWGILEGIAEVGDNIGKWVEEHIFQPFIDAFKDIFGMHSPSTVMEKYGVLIIEGLKNGLSNIWEKVGSIFENLGQKIGEKFETIKNGVVDWAKNTKETIRGWAETAKAKISDCWTNASNIVGEKVETLRNNISTGLEGAKTTISTWGGNIKNTFTDIGRQASTWGKDLTNNLASGIKNNIDNVTKAASSVAEKIKSFLHFSEPDVGPLSDFHTYMPDMIDLMATGIKNNIGKVTSELENLTSTMSYTINPPNLSTIDLESNIGKSNIKPQNTLYETTRRALEDTQFHNSNTSDIYLGFKIGEEELGNIIIDTLGNVKRKTGKGIEVLEG